MVNLEACLENRGSARMTDRGFGVGGIMYVVCMVRKKRNLLLQCRKYKLDLDIEKFARRRNPYEINMGQHNEASHIGESEKRRAETSRLEVDRLHDFPFETM